MLQLELYAALYLVFGCATWVVHKKFFEEIQEEKGDYDRLTQLIFMTMVIIGWWVFIGAYLIDFLGYTYRRLRHNRHICGAKFPDKTINVDLRCGLTKHDEDTFHEGVTQSAYGRWHVDEDGTVFIDRVKTY